MFGLPRNQYAWMSEVLEGSENIPVDENTALKTASVIFLGAGVAALNLWVLRKSEGWGRSVSAIVLLLATALALWSFFAG